MPEEINLIDDQEYQIAQDVFNAAMGNEDPAQVGATAPVAPVAVNPINYIAIPWWVPIVIAAIMGFVIYKTTIKN